MINKVSKKISSLLALFLSFIFLSPSYGENSCEMVQTAMQEYKAGEYTDSAGHFFAALSSEFNNPSIHYYMASCYAHMNERASAVQEFRITYALDPTGELGKRANAALKSYGVTPDGLEEAESKQQDKTPFKVTAVQNPWLNQQASSNSLGQIQDQVNRERTGKPEQSRKLDDTRKLDEQSLRKEINDLVRRGASVTGEFKSVSDRLQGGQDPHGSSVNTQQAGSNPYVRNYKSGELTSGPASTLDSLKGASGK
jgi:hypothetical protein